MPYSYLEHSADIRMDVEARTLEELFYDSLRGMTAILKPAVRSGLVRREIALRALDAPSLLIDFLNETLSLSHANKEAYSSVSFQSLSETALQATLKGNRASSFGDDIKAVTYHEAAVARDEIGVWRARVIFDV